MTSDQPAEAIINEKPAADPLASFRHTLYGPNGGLHPMGSTLAKGEVIPIHETPLSTGLGTPSPTTDLQASNTDLHSPRSKPAETKPSEINAETQWQSLASKINLPAGKQNYAAHIGTATTFAANMFANRVYGGPGEVTWSKQLGGLKLVANENTLKAARWLAIPGAAASLYALEEDGTNWLNRPTAHNTEAVTADLAALGGASLCVSKRTAAVGLPVQLLSFTARTIIGRE